MDTDDDSFWGTVSFFEGAFPDGNDTDPGGGGFHEHMSPIFSPMPMEYSAILDSFEMNLPPWEEEDEGGGAEGGEVVVEEGGDNSSGAVGNVGGCRNLLTERSRRMRLNQQLLSLRLLVPCISKMDKRSILMDAADYLQGLHEQIKKLELSEENSTANLDSNLSPSSEGSPPKFSEPSAATLHEILHIDIEKIDDYLFTIKVIFKKAKGAQSQVQRLLEALGFDISNTMIEPIDEHEMLITSFIHVKKNKHLTIESTRKQIIEAAVKCGIKIEKDD